MEWVKCPAIYKLMTVVVPFLGNLLAVAKFGGLSWHFLFRPEGQGKALRTKPRSLESPAHVWGLAVFSDSAGGLPRPNIWF